MSTNVTRRNQTGAGKTVNANGVTVSGGAYAARQRPEAGIGTLERPARPAVEAEADIRCACAVHADGSRTTMLCSVHADSDPCDTISPVTGRRRKGTIRPTGCTNCGWRP